MKELIEKLYKKIKDLAEDETCDERISDFDPGDGGNYDDAYSFGVDDGYIHMAREILEEIEELYNKIKEGN